MSDSHILKTKVADYGITQLIQRLGRDCSPLQFVREYTQNSIEAILRTSKSGDIRIDVNWPLYEMTQTYKMSFIDSGDGMTCDEMREHLNNLSSSGHADNVFENYGVGAKIASLTRNHAGVMYDSWKGGEGHRILIKYDHEARSYGIVPFDIGDGTTSWCLSISDDEKPEIIEQHGTKVTLFGMTDDQDTMAAPAGAKGGRENWLYQYLNTRYFKIPDDIKLMVRIGYYRDPENKRHNYPRKINGQCATLKNNEVANGVVSISDANIHWWILKKERSGHGRELVLGHTACLNQNELFDIADGRSSRSPHFGIIFGKENVVLYIEPSSAGYVQNTARTGLIQTDGSPLPWERWQDEFRAKMPKELDDYVKERMNAVSGSSHSDSIRDRLKSVAQFFKISRYRPVKSGEYFADPDSEVTSQTGAGSAGQGGGGGRRSKPGNLAGSLKEALLSGTKAGGTPSTKVSPSKFPEVFWVSLGDGRAEDEMDDRAAQYLAQDNIIKANADFQGFKDILSHYADEYGSVEGAEQLIKGVVEEAFEQQLVETVTGALSLKNRPKWNPDEFDRAISEEALTAAVMPRYFIMGYIKRQLGNRLRKAPGLVTQV